FQAEDGIRDFHVTGVQTCALPISDENLFKSHYAMLNLRQLDYYADSIQHYNDSLRSTVIREILPYYRVYNQYQPVKIESVNPVADRKSTRLNSSHVKNSYAVFCMK